MKITFAFGSEEIDCEELAKENDIGIERNEDGKIKTTHDLSDKGIKRIDYLKKLRMEDLCRQFLTTNSLKNRSL